MGVSYVISSHIRTFPSSYFPYNATFLQAHSTVATRSTAQYTVTQTKRKITLRTAKMLKQKNQSPSTHSCYFKHEETLVLSMNEDEDFVLKFSDSFSYYWTLWHVPVISLGR